MESATPTPCSSCGRDTITVDGVCKECWAYKGDDGRAPQRPLVEERASYTLFGFSMMWWLLLAVGLVVLVTLGSRDAFIYWLFLVACAVVAQVWSVLRRTRSE
jgi:hypothetical protein